MAGSLEHSHYCKTHTEWTSNSRIERKEGIRKKSSEKINKTGNVRILQYWGAFMKPLLLWISNEYYTTYLYICNVRYSAWNAHEPYFYLWPVPPPPPQQYFSTLCHKRHDFSKKKLLYIKMCALISSTTFGERALILRKSEWYMIENVYWSSCKALFILHRFEWDLEYLDRFLEKKKILKY